MAQYVDVQQVRESAQPATGNVVKKIDSPYNVPEAPNARNGSEAGAPPARESGIRAEKREEIKNGFSDRLTGILGKLIDKQAEMGGDFDGLFQPASKKQPIKRLFDNLTSDAGSGRAIDTDKLDAFMADDRGLAAVYEVLQLESSDLKAASEGIKMPGGRVKWLEAVYGVDPKLFKKNKNGMFQVPEKNRAAIGDKANLGELDGLLEEFRDANGIPVKEDFSLRLLRSLNSVGVIYENFDRVGHGKKVFDELGSMHLANLNGLDLVNTYQEVQAKLLAGEVNSIFKDIIDNKRGDELATKIARRREELRTGPEARAKIVELESDKAATQRMIAPVERFAAEMEESIGKTLSAAERADLRSELQGKQKELLDGVAIDGNPADYDNTLSTLQAVRDAAGDPEKLQELLDRNITIGGEEVITTRSVPVEPVAPERDVVDTTTAEVVPAAPPPPAPRAEVESARTAEHETLERDLSLRIAEARGRLELARELVKKVRKKVELPDNGFEDLKTIERVRRERELQQAKDQKKAAKKSLKQLESELAGVRQTTEVSATTVPVAAAVESTIPAPEPVAAAQPEAIVEPQTRTEIVVNEELIRERIEALIANRAELDPLEQAASGELDANKVREQMSEMQRALADALSIRVRAPDGLYGLDMDALKTLTLEQLIEQINDVHQESLDLQPDIPIVGWPEAENEDPEKMKMVVLARIEARLGPASGEFNSALAAIDTPDSAGFEVINLRLKEIQTELGRFLVRPEEYLLEIDTYIRQIKERGLVSDELDMIEGLVNSEKYNEIRSYFEDLPLEQSEGGINSEGLPGSLEEFLQEGIVTADDVNSGEYGAEYQGVDRAYANMLKLLSVTPRATSQDLIWQALRDHFNLTWSAEELPIESWNEAMVELRFHTGLDKDKYPGPPSIRPIAVSDLGEFFSEVMFKILENKIASAKAN